MDTHAFSADRAINKAEEDLLGRAKFSQKLAESLSTWNGKDSLVVALHGRWGSGKSSIKNMAIEKIAKNASPPDIVEFNPWEWAAQDKINSSFFNEISSAIGRKDKSGNTKKLSAAFLRYSHYLSTGEIIANGILTALPVGVAGFASLGFFTSQVFSIPWLETSAKWVLAISGILVVIVKSLSMLLKNIGKNLNEISKLNQLSLNDIRKELTELLSDRTKPLIVVMDDLDRLTSSQLRMVFQLVKANADFPNVVFLLLFQRDLVENKLSHESQSGRDFLEKIIQVPFDIPSIEESRVHRILFNKLDALIEQNPNTAALFDNQYWGNVFYRSLSFYLSDLRSVNRYISTLSFQFSLFSKETASEVNPVDLMALECIRIFEPDVYRKISLSKNVLAKSGTERDSPDKKAILEIIASAPEQNREYVKGFLRSIFPISQHAIDNRSFSSSGTMEFRSLRMCSSHHFDKYFLLNTPDGSLSNSELTELIESTESFERFIAKLKALIGSGLIRNTLEQLELQSDDIPIEHGRSYITALLNVGDEVDSQKSGFTSMDSNTHIMRLVIWFLRRIENQDERSQLLLDCFRDSTGLSIVETIIIVDQQGTEKGMGQEELILSIELTELLKNEFLSKLILKSKEPENILGSAHALSWLYRWSKWGRSKEAEQWLEIQAEIQIANVLKIFMSKSASYGLGDSVSKITDFMRVDDLEGFIPLGKVSEIIDRQSKKTPDADSKAIFKIYYDAIEARNNGDLI